MTRHANTEVLDRMPNQISEGEKQRLAVARAIVQRWGAHC